MSSTSWTSSAVNSTPTTPLVSFSNSRSNLACRFAYERAAELRGALARAAAGERAAVEAAKETAGAAVEAVRAEALKTYEAHTALAHAQAAAEASDTLERLTHAAESDVSAAVRMALHQADERLHRRASGGGELVPAAGGAPAAYIPLAPSEARLPMPLSEAWLRRAQLAGR